MADGPQLMMGTLLISTIAFGLTTLVFGPLEAGFYGGMFVIMLIGILIVEYNG